MQAARSKNIVRVIWVDMYGVILVCRSVATVR